MSGQEVAAGERWKEMTKVQRQRVEALGAARNVLQGRGIASPTAVQGWQLIEVAEWLLTGKQTGVVDAEIADQ